MRRRVVGVALAACAVALVTPAQATQEATREATPTPSEAVVLPPPPAVPTAPAPSTAPSPELVAQLEQLQEFPQTRPRGSVGLAVAEGTGQLVAGRYPSKPMLPASTMKLVTAAAALRLLGPQHRFVTRVYATAPVGVDGVVDGDLVLVGGGDPVLATPRFIRDVNNTRPATPLADLATAVAQAGVTRVTGRVTGDPSVLTDEPLAGGWSDDYLASLDTTRSSGLTVDVGLRLFERSGVLHAEPAKDPATRAADQLHELLEARNVHVEHAPARHRGRRTAGLEIARISSPPLTTLLAHALQVSDNHLADGIFRMLGAATGDPTWTGSERAVQDALSDVGDDKLWATNRLADGSGLSRYNRLTAETTVRLLHAMASSPLRSEWLRLQARAGETGTMQRRLAGTQAKGRVYAKTGTLRDVRSMAGTVPGPDGRDHHFAVFANDLEHYADIAAARRLADVMALALVVEQDGCRGLIPVPDTRRARAPEMVICTKKSN